MTTKQAIKQVYNDQFEALKGLANQIDALKDSVNTGATKEVLQQNIQKVEAELTKTAETMQKKSIELFQAVA